MIYDDVRDVMDMDANVLKYFHGIFEVTIIDVCINEHCTRRVYGAVKEFFGCNEASSWSSYIVGIVD